MSLRDCMKARGLDGELRAGLKALGEDSHRVTVAKSRKATHSIALDEALKARHLRDPRWDYGIGLVDGKRSAIAWVEVHTATSGEVETVLKKLEWLKAWLSNDADLCSKTPATFHWVATDAGVHIDTTRRRKLASKGLGMPKSQLHL